MPQSSPSFQVGDRVIWWKTVSGEFATPLTATVLGVTPKRVKIETIDDDKPGLFIRHVLPERLQPAEPELTPSSKTKSKAKPPPPKPAAKPESKDIVAPGPPGLQVVRRVEAARPEKDPEREDRIVMEIVVDAYGPDEQAMGWFYYLQEQLEFPFKARCSRDRPTSPLTAGDAVEVVGMADEDDCMRKMFVAIRWGKRTLAVPLAQLDVTDKRDLDTTREAVADWHYWTDRGYQLG